MSKTILTIIIITSGWYGYTHFKQQGSSILSNFQKSIPSLISNDNTKCITSGGNTIYGQVPQDLKCAKRENIDGSITIIPSNISNQSNKKEEKKQGIQKFICDGRTSCTQMNSCEEAFFFNSNCPDTKMDGDSDGTPCEQQWCN